MMLGFFGMSFEEVFSNDDIFTDDLRKSASTINPTIIPEIDLVYVLSGRSTVLGADADKLPRDFDSSDDIERLREGIRIANVVNALRAGKDLALLKPEDMVTPIFYNGRTIHNAHLRAALEQNLIDYPKELFIIKDIHPENTIGQVRSFKEYLSWYPEKHKNVAVVSSAYHGPRALRTVGNESPQTQNEDSDEHPIRELNLFFFGIHKNEKRKGIIDDLKGEHRAMINYSSGDKPSIARVQSRNTFFTDADFISAQMFKRGQYWDNIVNPIQEIYLFPVKGQSSLGVLRLIQNPKDVVQDTARAVLVESFIGEYEKYLSPEEIDPSLTSWRDQATSVASYYEKYFNTEFNDFLSGKLDFWVEARIGEKLVGWATFEREKKEKNSVYMNLLIVHPDYQGKSIGTNLVNSLINMKVIPNLNAINLLLRKKNAGGNEFYSKLGFVSDPNYQREDNFVNLDLLEPLTWKNPFLQSTEQEELDDHDYPLSPSKSF